MEILQMATSKIIGREGTRVEAIAVAGERQWRKRNGGDGQKRWRAKNSPPTVMFTAYASAMQESGSRLRKDDQVPSLENEGVSDRCAAVGKVFAVQSGLVASVFRACPVRHYEQSPPVFLVLEKPTIHFRAPPRFPVS